MIIVYSYMFMWSVATLHYLTRINNKTKAWLERVQWSKMIKVLTPLMNPVSVALMKCLYNVYFLICIDLNIYIVDN